MRDTIEFHTGSKYKRVLTWVEVCAEFHDVGYKNGRICEMRTLPEVGHISQHRSSDIVYYVRWSDVTLLNQIVYSYIKHKINADSYFPLLGRANWRVCAHTSLRSCKLHRGILHKLQLRWVLVYVLNSTSRSLPKLRDLWDFEVSGLKCLWKE